MVLKWKDEVYDDDPNTNIVYEKIKKENVNKHVEKKERWCKYLNPETSIRTVRKINEKKEKLPYKKIIHILPELPKSFTIKDIIKKLNGEGITDGSLQRKMCALMVCNGDLTKEIIEYRVRDEIKLKYVFTKGNGLPCKHLIEGKCTIDWDYDSILKEDLKTRDKDA